MQLYFSNPTSSTLNDFYQLDTNEAIVTVITLPPVAAYYSFQTNMFQRAASIVDAYQPGTSAPPLGTNTHPPDPTHCNPGSNWSTTGTSGTVYTHPISWDCNYISFGYFANTVNNADIYSQTSALTGGALEFNAVSPTPTYHTIAIVTTANQSLFTNISNVFGQLYGSNSKNALLLEAMPTGTLGSNGALNLGIAATSDTFVSIIRNAASQSSTDGTAWDNAAASNVLVFRVRESASVTGQTFYTPTTPALLVPTANTVETAGGTSGSCPTGVTSQSYYCDIQEIANDIKNSTAITSLSTPYVIDPASGATTDGRGCINVGHSCGGGTQDNDAYFNLFVAQLTASYPVFVIGVNHAASVNDPAFSSPPMGVTYSSPVNNASYLGVSAALYSGNQGQTDITQPNYTTTYAPSAPTFSGSAAEVMTAFSLTPSTALAKDLPNMYVSVFYRKPVSNGNVCLGPYCTPNTNYITFINSVPGPGYIDPTAPLLFTERGYLLPPATGAVPTGPAVGARAGVTMPLVQQPYVLCPSTLDGGQCQ